MFDTEGTPWDTPAWNNPKPGGGGTTPQSTPRSWSANWYPWIDLGLQAATSYANYQGTRQANRQNVVLSREQRAWEEMMSNTAVQRRKADIEKAGGNPALAFTNGSEATTPTVTAPQVQPAHFDSPRINTGALLAKAQLDNINANTYNTSADTRMKNTQARLLETFGEAGEREDLERKAKMNNLLAHQINKAGEDAEISRVTAELLKSKMTAAIAMLEAQARLGKLNADSSEAIARTLGVAGKDVGTVGKLFFDLIRQLGIGAAK